MDIMLPYKLLRKKVLYGTIFFSYTIWQKNKNKIWIFFLTFFNFIVVFSL